MQASVEIVVESLCQNGCQAVWSYIEELEAGRKLAAAEMLDDAQRQQVLLELKAIMAVYGSSSCTLDEASFAAPVPGGIGTRAKPASEA